MISYYLPQWVVALCVNEDSIHTTKMMYFQTLLHLWEYAKVRSQVGAVGWMGKHHDVYFSQRISGSQSTVRIHDEGSKLNWFQEAHEKFFALSNQELPGKIFHSQFDQ